MNNLQIVKLMNIILTDKIPANEYKILDALFTSLQSCFELRSKYYLKSLINRERVLGMTRSGNRVMIRKTIGVPYK